MQLSQISLRSTKGEGDRGIICGGTRSGKSSLASGSPSIPFGVTLLGDFYKRYPTGRILIADTKPRFRAEWTADGMSAKRVYKKWRYGAPVPGSVLVPPGDTVGLDRAWRRGRIAICQGVAEDAAPIARIMRTFTDSGDGRRPLLLYIDEAMDFYGPTGLPKPGTGNPILQGMRAGGERDVSVLMATQRAKFVSGQLWELLERLYLFRLELEGDMKRIREMGVPAELEAPEENHVFKYWSKLDRKRIFGPLTLSP
jgi:hypothetical protein